MKKIPTNLDFRYLVRESFLILTGSYLLFFASTHNGLVQPVTLMITAMLLTVSAIAWLCSRKWGPTPLGIPLLVFFLVLSFTSFFSIDPRRSFAEVWLIGISIYLYAATGELVRRGWPRELIIKVLLVLGAIFMGLAWGEVIRWHMHWHAATGTWIPSTSYRLPLPNFYSVILNIMLMMAITIMITEKTVFGRMVLAIWCISALGLIFFTSSRGGWLGTAAGLLCIGVWLVHKYKQKLLDCTKYLVHHKWFTVIGGIGSLIVLSGMAIVIYRQAVHPTHSDLMSARGDLWLPAWQAFLRSPWVGEGIYTFVSHYVQYHSVPPGTIYVYAHSIYLDLLSGSGILGLMSYFWLFISALVVLKNKLKISTSPNNYIGALASMLAFSVHGIFDSVHHSIPTSLWMMAILVGAVLGESSSQKRRIIFPVGLLIGLLVTIAGWINLWMILPMHKGVQEATSGNLQEARMNLYLAIERDPQMAITYQQQGMVLSQLAEEGIEGALDEAIGMFQKAILLDPYWPLNHANLGALLREAGRLSEAEQELVVACQAAPDAAVFYLNLGQVQEMMGKKREAMISNHKTLELEPGWTDAYYWRESDFRKEFNTRWKKENPSRRVTIEDLINHVEATKGRAAPLIALAERHLKNGEIFTADKLLAQAGLQHFSNYEEKLEYFWLLAKSASLKGEYPGAIINGQVAVDGFLNQGMYGPGSEDKSVYSQLMFRRPQMKMELVPQFTLVLLNDLWGTRLAELCGWYLDQGLSEQYVKCRKILRSNIPDIQ